MARRSTLEDLIGISTRMPWWGALLMGGVLFVATQGIPLGFPDTYRDVLRPAFRILGYIMLGACCVGAAMGFLRVRRERRLYDRQTSIESVRRLTWSQFEDLILEAFRRDSYQARKTEPGPDGGVDVVLKRSGETVLVQCKHWQAQKVGVRQVRELAGVVAAEGASSGILATAGDFTTDAREFALRSGIRLIDGGGLVDMLGLSGIAEKPADTATGCPKCGDRLVRRIAKRGPRSGEAFLGCARFPECRYTRDA